jgi:phage/plasmid-like protein (TIGR03299 family)
MSAETLEWLNVMTLIGDTETAESSWRRDGRAWHYRATLQGDEPNHYPGAIPVEDVRRRLFSWQPRAVRPMVAEYTDLSADGVETVRITDDNRQMIVRPKGALSPEDPGAILGVFKGGYKVHDYDEWLIRNVESILDDTLHIGSAGLLRNGAQAWVGITVPESITTPEGVEFRPFLYSVTSLDGSVATGYGRTVEMPICDNSLSSSMGEKGQKIKYKHTSNSLNRIGEVREALAIDFLQATADDFMAEVAQLTNTTVSDAQWGAFKDATFPLTDEKGNDLTGRSRTYAINRQAELEQLYRHDNRCTPWAGTAFGVLQTVNTHAHHVNVVKGMSRPLRNMDRVVTGGVDKLDAETLATLDKVLVGA